MGKKNELTNEEENKIATMQDFLKKSFKTNKIQNVDLDELKKAINGDHMIARLQYRKQVGNILSGKKQIVKKGEVFRAENNLASKLEEG